MKPEHGFSTQDVAMRSREQRTGLELLGKDVKHLMEGIQKLSHWGIESLAIPLPKIVCVGDQSTGKSSLIEGMSEIKVPRSAGTCTRCPLEINITEEPDQHWGCKIWLEKKYKYDPSAGRAIMASKKNPLGPWSEEPQPISVHFATIKSKEKVGRAIQLAQLATLKPMELPEAYKPANFHGKTSFQVKFSPNVVRVDITGPRLPNLSFYDLPGIIVNAETEEEKYLIDLVQNLVAHYVKPENCIVLLALPMSHDSLNSTAYRKVSELGALSRTVGCLTKPDYLQPGADAQWKLILQGKSLPCGFGYHVIKNNPDPLVSHAVARKEELEFFRATEPWANELREFNEKFGTVNLQTMLSRKLISQILSSLPRINHQIQEKLLQVEEELDALPIPPTENQDAIIRRCIYDFLHAMHQQFDGGSLKQRFQTAWKDATSEFRNNLVETRPTLVLPSYKTFLPPDVEVHTLDTDDETVFTTPTPSPAKSLTKRKGASFSQSPQKRIKIDEEYVGSAEPVRGTTFKLDGIRSLIKEGYTSLPDYFDIKVVERMTKESMAHWGQQVEIYFIKIEKLCEELVQERLRECFGGWHRTMLFEEVKRISKDFHKKAMKTQSDTAGRFLKMELEEVAAFNSEGYQALQNEAEAHFKGARDRNRAMKCINENEALTGKRSTGQARLDKISKKIASNELGEDPYKVEIQVISRVRAYYDYAVSRFTDMNALSIKAELFPMFKERLGYKLLQELNIDGPSGPNRSRELLAMDPQAEMRRTQLIQEEQALGNAIKWLNSLSAEMLEPSTPQTRPRSHVQHTGEKCEERLCV